MKAAVLHSAHDLRVEEVLVPAIGQHDLLVRVRACGVCASDVHYFETGAIGRYVVNAPMIVGHEAAGDVVDVGEQVTSLQPGARVAIEPGASCGRCSYCKSGRYTLCPDMVFYATPPVHGAMAEYPVIRADLAHSIPDAVSYEQAALGEPLSAAAATQSKPSSRNVCHLMSPKQPLTWLGIRRTAQSRL
ncbi:MAG: alcohol dehydrogenase catalytic domain-containing protein [Chloroflexi bacterium]|nr:alcohol dehydrogenase catalytic domain-containing protein [Chloroflexota bacterium]